jgi:hypothetical protein
MPPRSRATRWLAVPSQLGLKPRCARPNGGHHMRARKGASLKGATIRAVAQAHPRVPFAEQVIRSTGAGFIIARLVSLFRCAGLFIAAPIALFPSGFRRAAMKPPGRAVRRTSRPTPPPATAVRPTREPAHHAAVGHRVSTKMPQAEAETPKQVQEHLQADWRWELMSSRLQLRHPTSTTRRRAATSSRYVTAIACKSGSTVRTGAATPGRSPPLPGKPRRGSPGGRAAASGRFTRRGARFWAAAE